MPFLTREQLHKIGFAKMGEHLFISDKASFHNASQVSIGDYVRIDDFCVFSAGAGGIELGNFIHISCSSTLIGDGKIKMGNFSGISSHTAVYSSSDDFSGHYIPGYKDVVPDEFRHPNTNPVIFGDHTAIGAHSVVLPGVTINEGAVAGAMSLVRKDLKPWSLYTGNPLRFLKSRSKDLLRFTHELEKMRQEELKKIKI
ncbi:MAG: acyltransferase [Ginsengibacter sp.]